MVTAASGELAVSNLGCIHMAIRGTLTLIYFAPILLHLLGCCNWDWCVGAAHHAGSTACAAWRDTAGAR